MIFQMKMRRSFFGASVLAAAAFSLPSLSTSALATGSMAECTAAGFPKSCCLEQQNKGAWGESGEAARTRKWNELAICKTRAPATKPAR
jgi:hypothetical protein